MPSNRSALLLETMNRGVTIVFKMLPLLAANPFGVRQFTHDRKQRGSYTIPAGGSLVFRYRVVIHHGDPVQARVADAYRRFAADEQ